ncbi:hypothetical protein C5F47_07300 [Nitrosopumilus cobalaminigenes]|uniref:Uncharacterized protein n=1 Tax=Nitrosopumilus cobalaminigenes TaxID=1470066 RepID=A0A7D5RCF5_9ARCH|nr:hypothetical protein [Nitrosopumilus cobalaminigenes]QLH03365.1 hypothetical protein C5F47_07300 [Nitrosopumilus cobalaminigenes]
MAAIIIIPILIVTIVGLSSYLIHKFVLRDILAKRSVNQTLQKYNIKKTPSEIIKEYYDFKGERLTHKEIQSLEKNYRQNEPEQFLAMYDSIRDNTKNKERND